MKQLRRVSQFQILKGSDEFNRLKEICECSTKMYNKTLYILRNLYFASFPRNGNSPEYYLSQIDENIRKYIETSEKKYRLEDGSTRKVTFYNIVFHSDGNKDGKVMDEKALFIILHRIHDVDYERCQSSGSRNAIKAAVKAMKSYLGSKSKEKKLPRYMKFGNLAPFAIDNFKTDRKDGSITINGNCTLKNVFKRDSNVTVKQIRIVPKESMGMFIAEVVYVKEVKDEIPGNGIMAIDIGIDNAMAITDDRGNALLIGGRMLKSVNQHYNKMIAEINREYSRFGSKNKNFTIYRGKRKRTIERKRFNKMNTLMHQMSRYVVDLAVATGTGTIVIGHNKGWKNGVDIGKKNNQKFVQIPFNNLISKIRYKAEEHNINVVERDEAYTSKCSALDNEEICKHEKYKGRRGGRHNKEYITGTGKLINADINGSLNILRLESGKNIENVTTSILTPPKFNKVGFEKYKNAVPELSLKNGNMEYKDSNK